MLFLVNVVSRITDLIHEFDDIYVEMIDQLPSLIKIHSSIINQIFLFTFGKLLSSSRICKIPFGFFPIKSKQSVLSEKSIFFHASFSLAYSSYQHKKQDNII
jgi:hypothetical protein